MRIAASLSPQAWRRWPACAPAPAPAPSTRVATSSPSTSWLTRSATSKSPPLTSGAPWRSRRWWGQRSLCCGRAGVILLWEGRGHSAVGGQRSLCCGKAEVSFAVFCFKQIHFYSLWIISRIISVSNANRDTFFIPWLYVNPVYWSSFEAIFEILNC